MPSGNESRSKDSPEYANEPSSSKPGDSRRIRTYWSSTHAVFVVVFSFFLFFFFKLCMKKVPEPQHVDLITFMLNLI